MPPLAIINCDVFTPTQRISRGLVWVDTISATIRAVGRSQDVALPVDTRLIDAHGGWVTPGLIDLDWSGPEDIAPESLGITSYARVVEVRSEDDLTPVAQAAAAQAHPVFGARSMGLHVHLAGDLPAWEDLWSASDAAIVLITIAADHPDAPALGRKLLAAGIRFILTGEPPVDPFLQDLLACGLAALSAAAGFAAPYLFTSITKAPVFFPLLRSEHLLLASSPGQPLQARNLYDLSKAAKVDFAPVLAAASHHPARFLQRAQGRLAAGAPADLLCWTRFGELAWAMVGGQVLYPVGGGTWEGGERETQRRGEGESQGVAAIARFLRSQKDTLEVRLVAGTAPYAAQGIDLVWHYRQTEGQEKTTTVAVQTDDSQDDGHFRFATRPDRPGKLLQTQAGWYFYHFTATRKLYCLPVNSTRAWLQRHQEHYPTVDAVRLVSVARLAAAIPRARLVEMSQ